MAGPVGLLEKQTIEGALRPGYRHTEAVGYADRPNRLAGVRPEQGCTVRTTVKLVAATVNEVGKHHRPIFIPGHADGACGCGDERHRSAGHRFGPAGHLCVRAAGRDRLRVGNHGAFRHHAPATIPDGGSVTGRRRTHDCAFVSPALSDDFSDRLLHRSDAVVAVDAASVAVVVGAVDRDEPSRTRAIDGGRRGEVEAFEVPARDRRSGLELDYLQPGAFALIGGVEVGVRPRVHAPVETANRGVSTRLEHASGAFPASYCATVDAGLFDRVGGDEEAGLGTEVDRIDILDDRIGREPLVREKRSQYGERDSHDELTHGVHSLVCSKSRAST